MKRLAHSIGALLFLSLLLTNVAALEIDLKENYQPGETIIVSIGGNFIDPLTKEAISFYSGRLQIPLSYDIAKIEEKYYLYALLQNQVRNYSLRMSRAHFIENGLEETKDLEYNFSVSGNITDFSIDPGFIIAANDFSIKIQSKSKSLAVTAKGANTSQSVAIPAGQTKEMQFSISAFPATLSSLEISALNTKYVIPVKIISAKNASSNQSSPNITAMEFTQESVNITALQNSEISFTIILKNTGDTPLNNITLSSSEDIKINPSNITVLEPKDTEDLNVTIFLQEKGFFTMIRASSGDTLAQLPLSVTITENASAVVIPTPPLLESCVLLGGKICTLPEECKGDLLSSKEGRCCKGSCEIPKKSSNTSRYIAIAVIAAIILFIIIVAYKKSKAKKKQFSDVIEKRGKEFESKIHPDLPSEAEVRGKLTKT